MATRFSALVQTVSEVHPAFYTTGTGSFPGVKRPGRGADHPPSSAEVKERVELHLRPPLRSEFLATDTEVSGSIPSATRFSEWQWV